jgi:protein PhnA
MSTSNKLHERSGNTYELCASDENLSICKLPPAPVGTVDDSVLACVTCIDQIEKP